MCRYNRVMTETATTSYDDAVRWLARSHAEDAPEDLQIFLFPDPDCEVVRFLEVSSSHPAEDAATAWAVHFSPGANFKLQSAVILLTPEDWRRVLDGNLALPAGWELEGHRQVWPE